MQQVVCDCISCGAGRGFLDVAHVWWHHLKKTGGRVRKARGEDGGAGIVINAADATSCTTSGQCSHFQKSPLNSLQIPTGLQNPFKSPCNVLYIS